MDWIFWIIGTVGIGGALLIGAGLIFGWPVLIGTKLGRWALVALAVALTGVGIYVRGRRQGREVERAILKAKIERQVVNASIESKRIDALTDDQVDVELARWDRKT